MLGWFARGSAVLALMVSAASAVDAPAYVSPEMKAIGLQELGSPLLIPALKDVTMLPVSIQMDGRVGVRATGTAPSADWKDSHFMLIDNAETSADKFLDVAFLVVPPNGETGFGDETHVAERSFSKSEQGALVGLRVWGETGCAEMAWNAQGAAVIKPFAQCVETAGMVPVP